MEHFFGFGCVFRARVSGLGAWVPWQTGPFFLFLLQCSILCCMYIAVVSLFHLKSGLRLNSCRWLLFLLGFSFDWPGLFFLQRAPLGQHGPVAVQVHSIGAKPICRWEGETKLRTNETEVSLNKTHQKAKTGRSPRQLGTPRPGSQLHGPQELQPKQRFQVREQTRRL